MCRGFVGNVSMTVYDYACNVLDGFVEDERF